MKKPKTIYYPHTGKMSLEEWKKFEDNFKKRIKRETGLGFDLNHSIKEHLLKFKHKNFYDLINHAFYWEATPEGYDYWEKISRR